MKNRLHSFSVTLCLLLLCLVGRSVYAQAPRTIEVGPHFGATGYVGDLNVWRGLKQWDWKHLHQLDFNVGAVVRYNYDSRWTFRIDYSFLRLNAQDPIAAWVPSAAQPFHASLHDLSFITEFNFLDYYTGQSEHSISPYIFAGLSGFYSPQREKPYFEFQKKPFKIDLPLSIPFGVGCKISLAKRWASTVEWRMHYSLTDRLEGVTIADYADNRQTNDWFGMFNLSFTYKFELQDGSLLQKLLLVLSPFYYTQRK